MKYKCSWCGAEWQNSLKLPADLPSGTISHGICHVCAEKLYKNIDQFKGLPGKDENIKSFHRIVFNQKRKI